MLKVLIIDDDEDLSDLLSDWLSLAECVVELASTGEQGLKKLNSGSYDLILLDWHLPDMTGVETLSRYRAEGGTGNILMLTGKSDEKSRQAGMAAGANDFLVKPFKLEELEGRIQTLIKTGSLT